MDIQVLQGLNLEHNGSTIIIKLSSPIQPEILEKIKSFHPVFMEDYKLEDKKLTVYSKLTHLWVEIGKALQKLSNKDWSYDYTVKYILEEVIKKQILSMSTIPLLNAAIQEGFEVTQMAFLEGFGHELATNRRYIIGAGKESEQICSSSSSKDSYIGMKIQRDKEFTNRILDRLGISLPKWVELVTRDDIEKYWDDFKKPVVIKPNGLTGGNGVTAKIESKEAAYKAFDFAKEMVEAKERRAYQKKILMQDHVFGEDYRLLVIDGKFKIATKRVPASVTGDGHSTIEILINEINSDPRRNITNPAHILKPIIIEETLISFLKEQNLTIQSIPKKGEKIFVRKVASMSKGGTTEDFTESVHPQIKLISESVAKALHVFTLGVDLLCKDLSKPLTIENGAIIECNTMPEMYLNTYPTTGKQYETVCNDYIKSLLGKTKTKRIVYLGKKLSDTKSHLKNKINILEQKVGLYSKGNLFINDFEISTNNEMRESFEALKINASLDTIVHHLSKAELEEYGTGFERIDLLVIDKVETDLISKFEGMKNMGLIYEVETF